MCMGERVRNTNWDGCGMGLYSLHVGMGADIQGCVECGSGQVVCISVWAICMENLFPALHFQSVCIPCFEVGLL